MVKLNVKFVPLVISVWMETQFHSNVKTDFILQLGRIIVRRVQPDISVSRDLRNLQCVQEQPTVPSSHTFVLIVQLETIVLKAHHYL